MHTLQQLAPLTSSQVAKCQRVPRWKNLQPRSNWIPPTYWQAQKLTTV